MTTGQKIKELRQQAGLTQEQLATAANLATITIRQYESGARNPKLEPLRRIALVLGVTVDDIASPAWTISGQPKEQQMKVIEIFLPIVPPTVTHQEKKVTVVHGKPRFYEPAELKAARQLFTDWLAKYTPKEPMTGPVVLEVVWQFPADKHHPEPTPKTTKPDTDNLQKLLKDCMTAAKWWKDDAQVWCEKVMKVYMDQPGIYIRVEES